MFKRIKKLAVRITKFFTRWTRRTIIVTSGALVIGGLVAFYSLWQNNYIGADVATIAPESSNIINVKLSKSLADKVKTGNLDALTRKSLDDLTKAKIDSVLSADTATRGRSVSDQANSANDRSNLSDLIIAYQDENGKPILPDLEKLKSQSAASRAVGEVPESNKLTFSFSSTWTKEEISNLGAIIDEVIPKMTKVFGPPLFNNQILIDKAFRQRYGGYCGFYISEVNTLYINTDSCNLPLKNILIHELNHAWRDDLNFWRSNSIIEEGLAEFAKNNLDINSNVDSSDPDYIVDTNTYPFYIGLTPQLAVFHRSYRYTLSPKPFLNIYASDKEAIKRFHNKLWQQRASRYTPLQLLKESLPSTVIEGKNAVDWLVEQKILTVLETGKPLTNFKGKYIAFPIRYGSKGYWMFDVLYYEINDSGGLMVGGSQKDFIISLVNDKNETVYSVKKTSQPVDYNFQNLVGGGPFLYFSLATDTDFYKNMLALNYDKISIEYTQDAKTVLDILQLSPSNDDFKRKFDIINIQKALKAYYQIKGKYPDSVGAQQPNGAWSTSANESWASLAQELKPYLPNGVLPKDPVNMVGKWAGAGGYNYNYFSRAGGKSGVCQWYMLVYKFVGNDLVKSPGATSCDGKKFQYSGAITIDNNFDSSAVSKLAVNTAPTVKITSATAKRKIFSRYNLLATWIGSDKEDKTADLVYRYKIGKGNFSAWAKITSLNKDLVFTTTTQLTVEVKDSQGAVHQTSASIKLID